MKYPLITHDPITGEPLVVTRLLGPTTGIVIEGQFDLGWIGRLTSEQREFVGVLVRNRGNLQKVAGDMGASYNTARNRMDEIVAAIEGIAPVPQAAQSTRPGMPVEHRAILDRLAAGEITFEEAMEQIRGLG